MKDRLLAIYLAGKYHNDQTYGDGEAYFYHLYRTDKILQWAGYEEVSIPRIAVWLHDVLEDTDIGSRILCENFGQAIFDVVYAVTNAPGNNRIERLRNTLQKIRDYKNADPIAVKLADRISNIEFTLASNVGALHFARMYCKENITLLNCLGDISDNLLINNLLCRYTFSIDRLYEKFEIDRNAIENG
jgi:(p)ppGpp synthase/HD superfamily hydrolase